ncbi:RNA polymerase sigma factor [bacterium]|nr:RNA polymerase sigma factor [bacterium]
MNERERRQRFNELYALYDKRILAYCIYVLSDRDLANDVYQEVFVKAYQSLHTLREEGKEANWLFRIARNECLNNLKSRQRSDKRSVPIDNAERFLVTGDGAVERNEAEHLHRALDQLPDDYREALLLAEFEGFSMKEIAEITGASLSNVKVRIHRAKQKLHKILEPILNDYE